MVSIEFRTKPINVEAMEVKGWQNFAALHSWCREVYFVPQGYDHYLRKGDHEVDRGNGHTLEGAPAFVVLRGAEERVGGLVKLNDVRVNVGDWIVKDSDGLFCYARNKEFVEFYEPREDVAHA